MTEPEASEAVSSLYELFHPAAARYAWRLTGRSDVAEDIVQEAFFGLYRQLRTGKIVENPKAWTLSVIRVQARVRMGALRHEAAIHDWNSPVDELPADSQDPLPDSGEIRPLFSILTNREQEVIILRLTEMKYREIAAQLRISPSSVNTLLARALRKLQRASGSEEQTGPGRKQAKDDVSKTLGSPYPRSSANIRKMFTGTGETGIAALAAARNSRRVKGLI